jgi:NADPH2:quinone reductase
VDVSATHPVPEGVDDGVAVALGIAGLAGWLALTWSAGLRDGESVLVLGATGTVGQVAVQGAKLLGASRVVAAGRNPHGLERALELGADATVRLDEEGDLAERFRSASEGDGFDVIVDPLWGEPGVAAMEASKRFTRHVALGQSAGMHAPVSVATVRNKPLTIVGHTNYAIPFEDQQAAYVEMCRHAAAGELTADVESVWLDEVGSAWERLRAGSPGAKLVVVP